LARFWKLPSCTAQEFSPVAVVPAAGADLGTAAAVSRACGAAVVPEGAGAALVAGTARPAPGAGGWRLGATVSAGTGGGGGADSGSGAGAGAGCGP